MAQLHDSHISKDQVWQSLRWVLITKSCSNCLIDYIRTPLINAQWWSIPVKIVLLIPMLINKDRCWSLLNNARSILLDLALIDIDRHWAVSCACQSWQSIMVSHRAVDHLNSWDSSINMSPPEQHMLIANRVSLIDGHPSYIRLKTCLRPPWGVSEANLHLTYKHCFTRAFPMSVMGLYQWHKVYQLGEDVLHRPPMVALSYFPLSKSLYLPCTVGRYWLFQDT